MNQDRWAGYLLHLREPSDRHWAAEETPLGSRKDGPGNLEYLDPCRRVLDIGCGYGHAMKRFKAADKEVTGLDISELNVTKCLEAGLDSRHGDMHDLPFADDSMDGILMWDVFEHALAPIVVLWECARVLTPSGRMIIYTPPDNWADHSMHITIPTAEQMKWLAKKSGFVIEQQLELPRARGMLYHLKRDIMLGRKKKK